jgi:hypothetical protein
MQKVSSSLIQSIDSSLVTGRLEYVALSGGLANRMTGYLFLNDKPTSEYHAAPKIYVDERAAAVSNLLSSYLPLSGGVVTNLTITQNLTGSTALFTTSLSAPSLSGNFYGNFYGSAGNLVGGSGAVPLSGLTGSVATSSDNLQSGMLATNSLLIGQGREGLYIGKTTIKENYLTTEQTSGPWTLMANISSSNQNRFSFVTSSADGKYVASYAHFYNEDDIKISNNYGNNWTTVDSISSKKAICMSANGNVLGLLPSSGVKIYKLADQPVSSITVNPSSSVTWSNIAMSSDGRVISIGGRNQATSRGCSYNSFDYGNTWIQAFNLAFNNAINCLAMSSDGKRQAVASSAGSNYIYISDDYGSTWRAVGSAANYRTLSMSADGKYLVAVFTGVGVIISKDYGNNWAAANLPSLNYANSQVSADGRIQIVNTFTPGFANCGLYISYDYGSNWSSTTITYGSLISGAIPRIAMSSDGKICYLGSYRGIFDSKILGNLILTEGGGLSATSVYVSGDLTGNIGKSFKLSLKGDWNSGTTYGAGDIVIYNRSTFASNVDNNLNNAPVTGYGGTAPSSDGNWLLVSKGSKDFYSAFKSTWNSSTSYERGEIVIYQDSTYMCDISATEIGTFAPSEWSMIATSKSSNAGTYATDFSLAGTAPETVTITHDLSTRDVVYSIYKVDGTQVIPNAAVSSSNKKDLTLTFNSPDAGTYRAVVISSAYSGGWGVITGGTRYWYSNDTNSWSNSNNWWSDINHITPSDVPDDQSTVIILNSPVSPVVTLAGWVAPVSINANASEITFVGPGNVSIPLYGTIHLENGATYGIQ